MNRKIGVLGKDYLLEYSVNWEAGGNDRFLFSFVPSATLLFGTIERDCTSGSFKIQSITRGVVKIY